MIFSKIKDGGDALEARAITFESIFFIRQKESALSLDLGLRLRFGTGVAGFRHN